MPKAVESFLFFTGWSEGMCVRGAFDGRPVSFGEWKFV